VIPDSLYAFSFVVLIWDLTPTIAAIRTTKITTSNTSVIINFCCRFLRRLAAALALAFGSEAALFLADALLLTPEVFLAAELLLTPDADVRMPDAERVPAVLPVCLALADPEVCEERTPEFLCPAAELRLPACGAALLEDCESPVFRRTSRFGRGCVLDETELCPAEPLPYAALEAFADTEDVLCCVCLVVCPAEVLAEDLRPMFIALNPSLPVFPLPE
jgi:hypothetical protein